MPKAGETRPIETTPVTTKTLASNGGLEELLKKIGGVSLDDLLVMHRATEQPLFVPLEMVDNNLQVFLGVQDKKGGETKPFLIPDFKSTATYDGSVEDEQEIGGSTDARIFLRAPRSKPQIENISLSMWVAAKARIMHKLTNTGKLSGMAQIEDYHSYTSTVKVQCSGTVRILNHCHCCHVRQQISQTSAPVRLLLGQQFAASPYTVSLLKDIVQRIS